MSTQGEPDEEMRDRLAVIECAVEHFHGVDRLEHLLADLLSRIQMGAIPRQVAATALVVFMEEARPGAEEVLEYLMHTLRWVEVKDALEEQASSNSDFRVRDLSTRVLAAFNDEWPDGEIYRTYRDA